jgi:hypothetical protein
VDEIERQFEFLQNPPSPVRLQRPCQPGDGIVLLSADQQADCLRGWQTLLDRRQLLKFVPASGAATRMFKDLVVDKSSEDLTCSDQLVDRLSDFAFRDALSASLKEIGLNLDSIRADRDGKVLVTRLLETGGLNYGAVPKGLVLFHRYPSGPRSALEEQIREGAEYLATPSGRARYHFTVTESHIEDFEEQIQHTRNSLELEKGVEIAVDLSTQSPATDTMALREDGNPLRHAEGRLLLRPAGHGALLKNLQELDADVILIKNIDNVAHERLHSLSVHWKRVLAGYFGEIQEQIFALLEELETQPVSKPLLERGEAFLADTLTLELPTDLDLRDFGLRKQYLIDRLDRPLRVCGMVRNEGEPGGGPFWLPDSTGGQSGQIVEAAQIDFTSPEQMTIWQSSTHFNPVDLVCGLRDRHGQPYRLADFVDSTTSFVADKSYDGQPIRALERPGLWNGSMAGWNTVFVEVPSETFTPVKAVFDLLRPEHQP